MSVVHIVWSLAAGVSLALAALHLLVWFQNRRKWESLALAVTALAVVAHAMVELFMMHAPTPAAWGEALRWLHGISLLAIFGSMLFIHLYFGTGRLWLLGLTIGLRSFTLVLNFYFDPNINYREIQSLDHIPFLGEQVAVLGQATINPWMWLAQVCFPLWFLYVADASFQLWRRGGADSRRRAVIVGGGTLLFVLFAAGQAILVLNHIIAMPMISSLAMLLMVLAMGYELSRDLLRANKLADDLRLSENRLNLAARAARIALWEWRVGDDNIWISAEGRARFGITATASLGFQQFIGSLHPDDRDDVLRRIDQAAEQPGPFTLDYRVTTPEGGLRWVSVNGNAEADPESGRIWLRGVSADETDKRRTETELQRQRGELAHLSRVATLGELSGSLAHELNQPLAIILSNAQAAQRLLAQEPPDLAEVRDILNDIVVADRRAGQVITRLRALLKRGEAERQALDLSVLIDEVLALVRSDLVARGVSIAKSRATRLPPVSGDHIPLQQVLLNLLTNACDAMADNPPGERRVIIQAAAEGPVIHVTIRDSGCGLPDDPERIFEPFYTTKPHGLGMGLPICRTIIGAHGGRLWAEKNPDRGTTFHLELPGAEAAA
jgi:signal transduction histidine kinase